MLRILEPTPAMIEVAARIRGVCTPDPDTGCLNVPASTPENPRARVTGYRQPIAWHRIVWVAHHGVALPDRVRVIRACGNARCMETSHVVLVECRYPGEQR
jgi:hypothetical protein